MIPCDRTFDGRETYEENGITFYRWYIPNWTGDYSLTFRFISTNSPHPQGIWITRGPEFCGKMMLEDKTLPPLKSRFAHYLFKEGDYPEHQFSLHVKSTSGFIMLANAALLPNTAIWGGAARGSALWVEELDKNHFRFHCNDHDYDDDYDDLIFDVTVAMN